MFKTTSLVLHALEIQDLKEYPGLQVEVLCFIVMGFLKAQKQNFLLKKTSYDYFWERFDKFRLKIGESVANRLQRDNVTKLKRWYQQGVKYNEKAS